MLTPHEPYSTPSPSIGQRLTEARLARGLSLGDAERQTRIARRYLQALEADQFEVLPAPVYARGFLRNYARFLGLDEQELAAGLSLADRQPNVLPVLPPRSNTGIWMLIGVAFGLGVLLWAFLALGAFQSIGDVIDDIGGGDGPPAPTPIVSTPAPSFDCADLASRDSLTAAEEAWFADNCATPTPPSPTPTGDRTSCDEIRGTDYRSPQERDFFLANCLTPEPGANVIPSPSERGLG